jgi:hypothetical protein
VLDAQFRVSVTHEAYNRLPWKTLEWDCNLAITHIIRCQSGQIIGDCAPWYLKYTEMLVSAFDTIKIICIKRDKEPCVNSIYEVNNMLGVNHYTDRHSKHWDPDRWSLDEIDSRMYRKCFPKYDLPMRKAISQYYDDYYKLANEYENKFPLNFKVFTTASALNTEAGQVKMLEFCEIEGGFILPGIRLVKQSTTGGELHGNN